MINHYNYHDLTNIRFISFKWTIFVLDNEMLQIQFRSEYDEFSVITSNIANDVPNEISMNLSNFKHKINGIVLFMINFHDKLDWIGKHYFIIKWKWVDLTSIDRFSFHSQFSFRFQFSLDASSKFSAQQKFVAADFFGCIVNWNHPIKTKQIFQMSASHPFALLFFKKKNLV